MRDESIASPRGEDSSVIYSDHGAPPVVGAALASGSMNTATPVSYDSVVTRLGRSSLPARPSGRPAKAAAAAKVPRMLGSSPAIERVRELIALYGPEDEPVLITGETGAGKEAVAARLHAESARASQQLIVHNVARIDNELMGSQFFGHVKGAFTGADKDRVGLFERADRSSLHLDEIGDMPFDLQANFLRVLEDGLVTPIGANEPQQVDVRMIFATNKNLIESIDAGTFRRDLYHRIGTLKIDVPPLRDRGDDVVELAEAFIADRRAQKGSTVRLSPKAADRLRIYSWPGNIRDLKNCISRAVILAKGGEVLPDHIIFDEPESEGTCRIDDGKHALARYLTAKALMRSGGNISKAARLAGVSRTTLHNFRDELGPACDDAARLRKELDRFLDG